MPSMTRALSPELTKIAQLELKETPKKLEDGIQHLKAWLKKQPHLRACTDDQWLTSFLRGTKHNLEKAKEKIDIYYSMRNTVPDFFAFTPQDPKFKELLKTGAMLVLPKLLKPEQPRVVLVRPSLYDPNIFRLEDCVSFCLIVQQILFFEDDAFVVNGMKGILDLSDVTMAYILQMTPIQIKKIVVAAQDASPTKLKGLYCINSLPVFEKIINIMLKMVKEEHRQKVVVDSRDMSAIFEHIPKDILPVEYGGQGGTIQEIIDYWIKKIDEYAPWFEEDKKYGTDESKRLGQSKTPVTMFGIDGSFRQLEFD